MQADIVIAAERAEADAAPQKRDGARRQGGDCRGDLGHGPGEYLRTDPGGVVRAGAADRHVGVLPSGAGLLGRVLGDAAGRNHGVLEPRHRSADGRGTDHPDLKLYNNDNNNFAPFVGFAWSLPAQGPLHWLTGGKDKTVIRAGYGISYQRNSIYVAHMTSAFEPNGLTTSPSNISGF